MIRKGLIKLVLNREVSKYTQNLCLLLSCDEWWHSGQSWWHLKPQVKWVLCTHILCELAKYQFPYKMTPHPPSYFKEGWSPALIAPILRPQSPGQRDLPQPQADGQSSLPLSLFLHRILQNLYCACFCNFFNVMCVSHTRFYMGRSSVCFMPVYSLLGSQHLI